KKPQGPFVRPFGGGFDAVFLASSTCWKEIRPGVEIRECRWDSPASPAFTRLTAPIPAECRYDPTPGSTAAWRYGCPDGVPLSELIDGKNGWNFRLSFCAADQGTCTSALQARRSRTARLQSAPGQAQPTRRSLAHIRGWSTRTLCATTAPRCAAPI